MTARAQVKMQSNAKSSAICWSMACPSYSVTQSNVAMFKAVTRTGIWGIKPKAR